MKRFGKLLLVVLTAAFSQAVVAQPYPSKPVRIIVTSQTGTGSDVVARYLGDALGRALNQQFFVENRVGAGGNIGMAAAAKAARDGYTLVQSGLGTSALNQFLYPSLEYDPEKDFEPVGLVARLPFVFAVNPSFPANSLQELVAAAKAKPNSINATATSTTTQIIGELFARSTGASFFAIAYKGPGPAINDVMNGRVSVIIETVAALRPQMEGGKLRPLAVTTLNSSPVVPGVRSVSEQGFAGFGEFVGWTALFAPRATPQDIITLLNAELNKILVQPETRKRFLDLGFETESGTPQALAKYVSAERERWAPVIKSANIKAQ